MNIWLIEICILMMEGWLNVMSIPVGGGESEERERERGYKRVRSGDRCVLQVMHSSTFTFKLLFSSHTVGLSTFLLRHIDSRLSHWNYIEVTEYSWCLVERIYFTVVVFLGGGFLCLLRNTFQKVIKLLSNSIPFILCHYKVFVLMCYLSFVYCTYLTFFFLSDVGPWNREYLFIFLGWGCMTNDFPALQDLIKIKKILYMSFLEWHLNATVVWLFIGAEMIWINHYSCVISYLIYTCRKCWCTFKVLHMLYENMLV